MEQVTTMIVFVVSLLVNALELAPDVTALAPEQKIRMSVQPAIALIAIGAMAGTMRTIGGFFCFLGVVLAAAGSGL